MGTIVHRRIGQFQSGSGKGQLTVEMDWIGGDGAPLLREQTTFIFRAGGDIWTIDRVTTLTALDKQVVFRDNKEGVLGLRVARALEHRASKPEIFTDASGKPTAVPVLDNTGVTGRYVSSEGLTGDAVWGTRGRWTLIRGKVDDQPVTVAMLDHPSNPGFPTYWHARGYGLFAVNAFAERDFLSDPKRDGSITIAPGGALTFRYRVLIHEGDVSAARIAEAYAQYAAGK
jgi:hypothetical protein